MRKLLILSFLIFSTLAYAQPDTIKVVGQDPNNRGGDSKKVMQQKANQWNTYHQAGIDSLQTGDQVYIADYYAAPWGSDSNDGSWDSPWLTLKHVAETITAGDTVYFRGGLYMVDVDDSWVVASKDGTRSAPICIFNYPGEKPVLDYANTNVTSGSNHALYLNGCDWWNVKGLTIKHVYSPTDTYYGYGFRYKACTHMRIENCEIGYTHGHGIYATNSGTDSIFIINCDAHHNADINGSGGVSDGIAINSTINYSEVRGCRTWAVSDDGFDNYGADGLIRYDNCWSWGNTGGLGSGEGNGWKLGPAYDTSATVRIVTNCISVNNVSIGFKANGLDGVGEFYNNIAYNNLKNYDFAGDNPDTAHIFKNNISYEGGGADSFNASIVQSNNDWNRSDITITDADFLSLDTLQLYADRKPDGSLPDIDFLKPTPQSALTDGGIPVDGVGAIGSAVDIGAVETSSGKSVYEIEGDLTDGAPTDAEIDTSTSNVPANCNGWTFHIQDTTGTELIYSVTSNGTNWQYQALTIAL